MKLNPSLAKPLETKKWQTTNKYRTVQRLVSEMVDGTTLEVDDLVRKKSNTKATQSFDCSSRRNHADANSTGLKGNTVEKKRRNRSSFSFQKQCYPNTHLLVL